ncbi:MAG: UDP-N-acetylglucosamine 2-epimerase (non-hydrolyzing) [Candidatus Eisenbacteria bacterium]|uniref:UDP-N-acetylglucosamine 2-epimerase (Non-hydrolyzing) n=1 Tax=Eiseniibacteriota bacterium TaxID=2212470 RepID=A0A538TKW8_UNCEI|nr:MAG: UDP-N-acetylglucosamine 2-epimerase (non-hydrolyzing) [Candidatus Eisenbacteria bacterium]
MKMAPILESLRPNPEIQPFLVHTGQHYDAEMSRVFFDELGLPEPDQNLEIGSGTHGRQTGQIMSAFDALLEGRSTSAVVVVGDVNSTMACGLVAVKRGIPLAHVEAGLRSWDRSMPEEINRLVTDAVSDLLFATSEDAVTNLAAEGIPASRVRLVGNPMIDTLRRNEPAARGKRTWERFGLSERGYALVTLHRPSNVDNSNNLRAILHALDELSRRIPILFPAHPRTLERIRRGDIRPGVALTLTRPVGYLDFLSLMTAARFVLTDSGGVQEETTALGVPCLTLRENTERPVTVSEGTNKILGADPAAIVSAAEELLQGGPPSPRFPALWDGHAGQRIAAELGEFLGCP